MNNEKSPLKPVLISTLFINVFFFLPSCVIIRVNQCVNGMEEGLRFQRISNDSVEGCHWSPLETFALHEIYRPLCHGYARIRTAFHS